jgi:DNA adenine methylase
MNTGGNDAHGTGRLAPPLKWHGGKHYLARRIVALMPPHLHYVEPFAGSLAVLLAKDPEGVSEVANDINGALMNFWRVLRDEGEFAGFQRMVQATAFSEADWGQARALLQANAVVKPDHVMAWAFFVACRQSLAGRMDCFAPLSRTRTRRGMNEQASAWLSAVEGLPEVHGRLRRVVIRCVRALEVIRSEDSPETLFYLDPPYLHETRTAPDAYAHEMSAADHEDLLDAISGLRGKFLLSGYDSVLYRGWAERRGWARHEFDLPNHAAGGDSKRRMTEVVWANF